MLELMKSPTAVSAARGATRGILIELMQRPIEYAIGESFGYSPQTFRNGLDVEEYKQLQQASAFEKGSRMLGVGSRNAPGIDGIDLDNNFGVSLKRVQGGLAAVGRNAEDALESVTKAGFYSVNLYIDAKSFTSAQVTGLTKIQGILGNRINKVVIFTKDGPVVYSQTKEQQAEAARRESDRRQTGSCPAERRDCQ